MTDLEIRAEIDSDRQAVYEVNAAAFPTPAEAQLVNRIRAEGGMQISLVAVVDSQTVGHILLTPVQIEKARTPVRMMGLGPMAVLPQFQSMGIGSRLVRAGLEACRSAGVDAVVLVGHVEFYSRFGFESAPLRGLFYHSHQLDPYFMVIELRSDSLRGVEGWVRYHPAFDAV